MSNVMLKSLSSTNRIKQELIHGEDYKNDKKKVPMIPIHPAQSPIDITYFVRKRRRIRVVEEEIRPPDCVTEKRPKAVNEKCIKSKSVPFIENSFLERAKLSHKQYIDILSTPTPRGGGDNVCDKKQHPQTAPIVCSPRLTQMACPNKRLVLGTWRDFGRMLPAVTLHRFYDMLYSDQNIDMKEARKFFTVCDRRKRRLERKLKFKKKKKKHQNRILWIREQIEETSIAILTFFSGETRLDLSFKQLILSDVLLVILANILRRCDPILRFTSNEFDKELVKMVDKIAIWVENVSRIVEIQALEEEDEILKLSDQGSVITSLLSGAEAEGIGILEEGAEGIEGAGEGEEVEGVSSLQRLIQILANASSGYLSGTIEDFQNITRNEILNKIKVLNKDYKGTENPVEMLKKILLEWALYSQPSQVDVTIIRKIEKVSELLAAMLTAEDLYGLLSALKDDYVRPDAVASELIEEIDFGEDAEPIPGTLTEVISPEGDVQIGVVDEFGEVTPVRLTPSGNLIPTVYDKKGKVVEQLYDVNGNLLDVTYNKYGVPEPVTYNGDLYDDVFYEHELIFNSKGRIIPLCYDKYGNPIGAAYDEYGNPIWFGPDGKPLSIPPGCHVKWVNGKMVIIGLDGEEIPQQGDIEEEMEDQEGEGYSSEELISDIEKREEVSPTGSRESMITVIKGHKPKKVYEHSKDTVCCLSLKIWAVWLLEITHNANNWTKWICYVISQIREFACILRGDVFLPNGQKKVVFKDDWAKFVQVVNEDIIAWRHYCKHVNDLTNKIIEKFHGKKVYCCEKCLQDHLIKNVVIAHETMRALTEALNCAGYWQRCLDEIVQAASKLMTVPADVCKSLSDVETGWSYSSSSDDDKRSDETHTRRKSKPPCPNWKKIETIPSFCPCTLKQLFPKPKVEESNVDRPCLPRRYYL